MNRALRTGCVAVAGCLLLLGIAGLAGHALAQAGAGDWAAPVNLSRSGAASNPAIVVVPDGTLRVLWWDRFEGLMVADGPVPVVPATGRDSEQPAAGSEAWPDAEPAPILLPEVVQEDGQDVVVPTPIEVMPRIVGDAAGRAQAFWLGEADELTGEQPLHYSRLAPGRISWSPPLTLAVPAAAFDATADLSGTLHLAYVQPAEVGRSPSGLYYRRSRDGGASWSTPTAIHPSRYLRLLPVEGDALRLTADDANNLAITWQDPRQGQVLLSQSTDGGATWQEPRPLLVSDWAPLRNELIALPGQARRLLWPLAGEAGSRMAVSSSGDALALAGWDGERWAATRHLDLDLRGSEVGPALGLGNLRLAFAPSRPQEGVPAALAAVGIDPQGDLWITAIGVEALAELLASHLSAPAEGEGAGQGGPVNLSQSGAAWDPAIVAGLGGSLHAFWWDRFDGLMVADGVISVSSVPSGTEEVVTFRDSWLEPRPVPLAASSTPWILSDAHGRVHALWLEVAEPQVDGEEAGGRLLYSRLAADGTGWSSPVVLAESALAFDVAAGSSGSLHLAYLLTQQTPALPAGVYYRRTGEDG
ncbi:MAG TPA: hypothetical protein VLC52_12165, partial [Anaerolineae bacterium]|nr:hypothetical protein [Anaerolineae bacterium]